MDEKVYHVLEELNIPYQKYEHPAMFTVADGETMDLDFGDAIDCKNLFLKDSKTGKFYLVSLPCSKRADIRGLIKKIGAKKLSFASDDELYEHLGVRSGSASILNIIEVEQAEEVTFVIDRSLQEVDRVCFHPNLNTASIAFKREDMHRILDKYHANYVYLEV